MIVMNERFLANAGSKYGIDMSLPLRLQKRALLRALGVPGDPNLKACRSSETRKIKQLFKEYCGLWCPFLIIVSEKPMPTLVPPLFVVNNLDNVQWRDDQGAKQIVPANEALAIVEKYPSTTWVEFAPIPWGERTIAVALTREKAEEKKQQLPTPKDTKNRYHLEYTIAEIELIE